MYNKKVKKFIGISIAFVLLFTTALAVKASHSWGNYHWARTANPFTLKLGDNLSTNWDLYLATASNDWNQSTVLDTSIVPGQGRKNCRPTSGRVEVCNSKYGSNGWLGIAQIWISGGEHITQGITKMNDTYFNTPKYNTPAWKQLVVCQEIAHAFGLDHQDEAFDNDNLNTCMDYTSSPESNQHPNPHDYQMLEQIYTHLDSFTTINQTTGQTARQIGQQVHIENLENPGEWGRRVRDNGHVAVFERDFGLGNKVVTHVIWATE